MYTTREHCITVLYHAIENTVADTFNTTYVWHTTGRLAGCNAIKYTRAFRYSDWLYLLLCGITSFNNCQSVGIILSPEEQDKI